MKIGIDDNERKQYLKEKKGTPSHNQNKLKCKLIKVHF